MRKTIIALVFMAGSFIQTDARSYSSAYIIGGAAPNEWNLSRALKMENAGLGAFTWTGTLKTGDLKFLENNNWYWPGYLATTDCETLEQGKKHKVRYSADIIDEDYKFMLDEGGVYKVNIDLLNLEINMERINSLPAELWIEGTAVPDGKAKLTSDQKGNLTYKGKLNRGTLRFMTTEDAGSNTIYYIPFEDATDLQDGSSLTATTDSTAEGYWVEVASDCYKIFVDRQTHALTAAPFRVPANLYLIGGATEAEWELGKAIAFTPDADNKYLFTCRAELRIREGHVEPNLFKILGQNNDWGPYSLHPATENEPITDSKIMIENIGDAKWSVPADKQGSYLLTVDLLNGTINADYLDDNMSKEHDMFSTVIENVEAGCGFGVKVYGHTVTVAADSELYGVRLLTVSGSLLSTVSPYGCKGDFVLGHNIPSGVYLVCADTADGQKTRKVTVR